MQSTPEPFLGTDAAPAVAALLAACCVLSAPLLSRRGASQTRFAVVGGSAYAVAMLVLWAGPRSVTAGLPCSLPANLGSCLPLATAGAVVYFANALVALYAFVRFDLVAPLVGAAGATALFAYLSLQLGGEIESLVLIVLFGGAAFGGLTTLAVTEYGTRSLLGRS